MIPRSLTDWDAWEDQEKRLRELFRWAGGCGNTDELTHIAATFLVFAEARALLIDIGQDRLPNVPIARRRRRQIATARSGADDNSG
jgi:hypothetical protein